jgi:hypothetical protein
MFEEMARNFCRPHLQQISSIGAHEKSFRDVGRFKGSKVKIILQQSIIPMKLNRGALCIEE